jgi:hypothetical protein
MPYKREEHLKHTLNNMLTTRNKNNSIYAQHILDTYIHIIKLIN